MLSVGISNAFKCISVHIVGFLVFRLLYLFLYVFNGTQSELVMRKISSFNESLKITSSIQFHLTTYGIIKTWWKTNEMKWNENGQWGSTNTKNFVYVTVRMSVASSALNPFNREICTIHRVPLREPICPHRYNQKKQRHWKKRQMTFSIETVRN